MADVTLRAASAGELPAVLAFWQVAAENDNRPADTFREFGGTRADAMVLDGNNAAHGIWAAHGYRRQDAWYRWVKPL